MGVGGPRSAYLNALSSLKNRPLLCSALVCILTLSFRAALLPWEPIPLPGAHDEFSYLLAADTYASGRLTNPPHPFWQHFETFHIIQQPTYASKYPPLQGLVLALGQKLLGHPWFGVWISAGLMCGAVCWMLSGWISAELALLGAALVVLRIGVLSYWMNSYWGGAVPALGAALMLGALGRIVFRDQFRHAVTFAAGLAILLNSRPYEGTVLALLSAAVLVWKLRGRCLRLIGPAAAVLAPVAIFMIYYDYRVTGSPLELPYQVHEQQYAVAPLFAWSSLRPEPVYRHAVIRKLWAEWDVKRFTTAKADLPATFLGNLGKAYNFLFGMYPLFIPLLVWPYALKTSQERIAMFILAGGVLALLPMTILQPHYAATILPLLYLRFLQSIRRLTDWRPAGKPFGFALALFFVALIPCQFGKELFALVHEGPDAPLIALERQAVVQSLEKLPGRHLVLVRYSSDHDVHQEWVYNRADIDASRIVWAREMGRREDAPFMQYFHERDVWLLEPDQSPPRLTPYPAEAGRLSASTETP